MLQKNLLKRVSLSALATAFMLLINVPSVSTGAEMGAIVKFDMFSVSEIISHEIYNCSQKYTTVPEAVAYSQARVESNYLGPDHIAYDPHIISTGGDIGIFQIRVPAARDCYPELKEVPDTVIKLMLQYDIKFNVRTYFKYMELLQVRYKLSLKEAITAYNRGILNAKKPTEYITKVENYVLLKRGGASN